MGKRLVTVLCFFSVVAVCLALGACAVFNQPRFGKLPQGNRLDRIQNSSNYKDIDCLLISRDHWDHLDYPTITSLEATVKQVIGPLGIGAYLEFWGYPKKKICEGDWYDWITLGENVVVHVLPARHYSGRLFKENKTLRAGFALETPDRKIFYSGDSGYGPHFTEIGDAFHGFDLVLLDCGQYDARWAYIHMTPEGADQAALDLGARACCPPMWVGSPSPTLLGMSPLNA